MKPMLDPKRDLAGATPETLARALFRRVVPLRPRVDLDEVSDTLSKRGERVVAERGTSDRLSDDLGDV